MASKKKLPPKAKPLPTSSRAKPDALAFWDHDGRLADAMRAGRYKMSPAAFAAASADTLLHGEGVRVRIVDGSRVYSARGNDFASLAIENETLVLRFAAPENKEALSGVDRLYNAAPGKRGWLEFRRPATRDPRPSLDANVGAILGRATFERNLEK